MGDFNNYEENSLHFLMERAKELNCLYQVEELLNNQRLSLPEIFESIVNVLPSGWQYPDLCKGRIVYDKCSYETPGFYNSPYLESCPIKVEGVPVGVIEVIYTKQVPMTDEGYFLEKERKLIKTIADRIGQTILHRRIKEMLVSWNELEGLDSPKKPGGNEWLTIVDLLLRTDPELLLHVSQKMVNFLYHKGIKEIEPVMQEINPGWTYSYAHGEVNYPSEKLPLGNIVHISEKTFAVASKTMSDNEIATRLKKWIQEQKAYFLIKTVARLGSTVGEILEAIIRYRNIAGDTSLLYHPAERWLEVALIRRFLSDNLKFIEKAKKFVCIQDFYEIVNRMIFPAQSSGRLGGKSTGLFLAQQIIKCESQEQPLLQSIKIPKTWYITSDEVIEFLHYNNLENLYEQKYKDLSEIRMDYPNIIQTMKNARFPSAIIRSLNMALDDFGDSPLIVRSSSLLEDQSGTAFSGKYKSLFLANQGKTKKERLKALMDAIIEVYASIFSPDSIKYRAERSLLDFQEEMGIMIQEVVGVRVGPYHMPLYSGVVFSNNEFRWSPRIKYEDGLIRLVMGLGTRAVDRLSDDFPILISPGQPSLRVNTVPEEILYYSPKMIDVINLETNRFETIPIKNLLKEHGSQINDVQQIVSVYQPGYIARVPFYNIDFEQDELVVTFDGLISDTNFIKKIKLILNTLQDKIGSPVDIEFASDGSDFYLLQCRPQSSRPESLPAPIPKDLNDKDVIFSANRHIANGLISDISHIVYVVPEEYGKVQDIDTLYNVGKAVGILNTLLPKRHFILIGPGRWGSRGDIKMGVQVSYADISNTAALIEVARRKSGYVPEPSFGTHFFQDLVEANIRYLALYPDDNGIIFNDKFFRTAKNILNELIPEYSYLDNIIKVIDVPASKGGRALHIAMNADLSEALGYLDQFSMQSKNLKTKQVIPDVTGDPARFDDSFWRWRFYMSERIAESMDMNRFGVHGLYLIGSTNNGTAGPGSDIDLLVHFRGSAEQRQALADWLEGWSNCLAEMNYLKTGYRTSGLLDVHIITDEDIEHNNSFAAKIGAVTDPAFLLKLNENKK